MGHTPFENEWELGNRRKQCVDATDTCTSFAEAQLGQLTSFHNAVKCYRKRQATDFRSIRVVTW
jgi:hypothetical protein